MKYEKCFETNEMPDHPPTTNKIWLGLFSGCLISIIFAPLLIIAFLNAYEFVQPYFEMLDSWLIINHLQWLPFALGFASTTSLLWPFIVARFKKMVKP